ncbi:methyltransferase domain-containing protein [Alphaproteobacteria bacterium]|nr:methyltransferase domain-containing protein [Alphaproteobacteria bacterium]
MEKKLHFNERQKSLLSNKNSLEKLHVFNNFPVFIGATDEQIENDVFFDMVWDICRDTGIIQLRNLINPNIIYSQYHSEATGEIWKKHHEAFCEFSKNHLGTKVIEIGGSNGVIANKLISQNKHISKYTMIEPNPFCSSTGVLEVIKSFFDEKIVSLYSETSNTVIHSHTFEHVYEPDKFILNISKVLDSQGTHLFSVPNLKYYLKNKFTNTLNFEHTYYLTEEIIEYLLNKHGFELIECKYFHEHSIFYAFKKTSRNTSFKDVDCYNENKSDYLDFINHYKHELINLNKRISNFKGQIYMFGGHIFSQFLLNNGIISERIEGILDNSTSKIGKRLYGTNKLIYSPEILSEKQNVALILKAGQYQEEIKEQIKKININCNIWE